MQSKTDIICIRKGNYPKKVMIEGDSLGIGATTHSFFWPFDLYKKCDYEPVAVTNDKICLTRFHNHGIVIWEKYTTKGDKPIVYFTNGVHTPVVCSKQPSWYVDPTDPFDRLYLKGYFLGKLKKNRKENQSNYETEEYSTVIVDEEVPRTSKFLWDKLEYYVIVGTTYLLETLIADHVLRRHIDSLAKERHLTI